MNRRQALATTAALACVTRPAHATPEALQAALAAFCAGAPLREGRVLLEIEPLVENGNGVPVRLRMEDAALRVRRFGLFTELNPEPGVAVFHLGALVARPEVSTRLRLATTQQVVAVAELADGSCWTRRTEVIVTLAACVEG